MKTNNSFSATLHILLHMQQMDKPLTSEQMAAFIEGIVTRHYDENIFISIAIIVLTLAFILYYFVIYPLSRRNKALKQRTEHAIAQ